MSESQLRRTAILSHFSLPQAGFEERVAAAAGAGFDGIGLNVREHLRLLDDGWTIERVQQVLDAAGIALLEVEALRIFDDTAADDVQVMVEAYRPLHVQVIAPFEGVVPRDEAGDRFAALCARFAPFDTKLAIEFLPFTDIRDAGAALSIIEAAGGPANGGLCVDAWHVFRGTGLGQLDGVPPERVSVVQFDDGPMQPFLDDYLEDCLHHREVPGDGEFDLISFLRALPADVPLSVEVIDDDLIALDPTAAATIIAAGTRNVLSAVGQAMNRG